MAQSEREDQELTGGQNSTNQRALEGDNQFGSEPTD